jgi:hypothetical protein
MYAVYLANFVASLIIAGAFLRFVELKWPDSWVGRSLAVIY